MNSIFALTSVFLLCSHVGLQDEERYGKTDPQILELGLSSWYRFYTSKAGESTYAMSNAYGIYADAAERRNTKQLLKKSTPLASRVKRISKLLTEFGSEMTSLGSSLSGGGTMWGPIGSSTYALAQDVVWTLLTGQGKRDRHKASSEAVAHLLAQAPTLLKDGGDILTEAQKSQAKRDLLDSQTTWNALKQEVAPLPKWQRSICFGFCLDQAKLINIAAP